MNWTRKEFASGWVSWSGQDSIYNEFHGSFQNARQSPALPQLGSVLLIGSLIAALFSPFTDLSGLWAFLVLGWVLFFGVLFFSPKQFRGSLWVLVGGERGALKFYAGEAADVAALLQQRPRWELSASDIGGVEAGRTVEWTPARNGREVPAHEYQTFVITTGGRRLVIYSANADREATGALALSVKSWVEANRNATGAGAAAAPAAPQSEKGFSL